MRFPLNFGLEKIGLPLILTSGRKKNVCFLIDTGSTHNTLFSFVYEHFKDDFRFIEENKKQKIETLSRRIMVNGIKCC